MSRDKQSDEYFPKSSTYQKSGVSIEAGERLVDKIKKLNPNIGGFAGIFPLNDKQSLVSCTDGVGTKLELSISNKSYASLGQDLVAMSLNDLIVTGAKPLFFLDYYATGKLDTEVAFSVITGIRNACFESECVLLGGETAEMPGFYAESTFDLAGFAVGIVDNDTLIDGSKVKSGDTIIGLPSSGFHANGYSLVRKILLDNKIATSDLCPGTQESIINLLTKPTNLYVKSIRGLLLEKISIAGMAHITGGGLTNIQRVLPNGLEAQIDRRAIPVPPIVKFIKDQGNICEDEAFTVWNMGLGFVVIVDANSASIALKALETEKPFVVGKIVTKT